MTLKGVEVGMRLETRSAMKGRYRRERSGCADCGLRCTCTYECTVCGATRTGAPNHPGGACPEA